MGRYLGLKGTRLNVAIGIIAGLDFLYDPESIKPSMVTTC